MPNSTPPPPSRPCPHQILHRKPTPVTHPSPPKEKRRHRKHKPPRLENNCTLVVDSSVCDNFNLILILVVRADNLFVYNTLEVFLIVCGLGLCALEHRPLQ